ncbi:MAG: nuclear transport factor 2 family protein [Acidimicrobiales bacterium]
MTPTENARTVALRYADAWQRGDTTALLDCYADEFTLHYFGANPFTGDHVGKDTAVAVLLEVGARAPRRLVSVDEILAGPDAAVLVAREELTIDGEAFEIRRVLRYRVEGDRFTECWLYEEHQALIDRAWA